MLSDSALLRPLTKAQLCGHSDDWPDLQLRQVEVHDTSSPSQLVSLLTATRFNPVTVTGKLQPLADSDVHLLLHSPLHRTQPIRIDDVQIYSYGLYEDGSAGLWAGGRAGWFRIMEPTRAYRATFYKMIEALRVLYFAADEYNTPVKLKRKCYESAPDPARTITQLFQNYATRHADTCSDAKEAEAVFVKHKDFLITSMIARKEGLIWSDLPLYKYFHRRYPQDFEILRRRLLGDGSPQNAEQQANPQLQPLADSLASRQSLQWKGKEMSLVPSGMIAVQSDSQTLPALQSISVANRAPKKDKAWRRAQKIWRMMQQLSSGEEIPQQSMTIPNIAAGFSKKYNITSQDQAEKYIEMHAQQLLWMMRTCRSSDLWTSTKIFQALLLVSKTQSDPQVSVISTRSTHMTYEDSDPSEVLTARRLALKGKSALRPKAEKLAGKGACRHDSKPYANQDEEVRDDAHIRPSATKRMRARLSTQSLTPENDVSIDVLSWPSESPTAAGLNPNIQCPAICQENRGKAGAPGDSWLCPLDGCTQKVYAASLPKSKALIKEHYETHMYDGDERVQLVKSMEKPELPLTHLMSYMRDLARKGGLPPPVVQKF
ncbi:hypothetical protein LTR50_001234 [Elasticomyces elasticus]|nr:hypothetical protein LTR50_001234 [Elasticomyces elasticus]